MSDTKLHPSLLKRLLSALYDSFLILATTFIATALTLPFTKGDVSADKNIYMSLYLFLVIYIFYGWFWTHGGQTLGMRAWKQRLVQLDGSAVNWQQSFIRVITGLPAWGLFLIGLLVWMLPEKINLGGTLAAIPGWSIALLGFIWVLLDTRSNNWRDKLSGTHIINTSN
jgi:uncharacterized RDD family membrane protein YckC